MEKIFIKWYSNFSLLSRRQTPFFPFERFLIQCLKAKVKVITMADPREGKHQKKLTQTQMDMLLVTVLYLIGL